MTDSVCILLFDVDGVLVDPLAYRIGVTKTLEQLYRKVGLINVETLVPDESEVAYMEACGVHDVWDMTNIIFANVLAEICLHLKQTTGSSKLNGRNVVEKLEYIKSTDPRLPRLQCTAIADSLALEQRLTHPPDIAFAQITQRLLSELNQQERPLWFDLLRNFLVGTRSAYESEGTRLFQNIILGNEEFEKTYRLKSEYNGESLLTIVDKVLISAENVELLLQLQRTNSALIAIYTARPSLPPPGVSGNPSGYSPEAELAQRMAGLQDVPLVGMGMMEWLAHRYGKRSEALTKPNTTQALCALMASVLGATNGQVLETSYRVDKLHVNPDNTPLHVLKQSEVTVYVFEDTVSGIKPMLQVAERLNHFGFSITVKPLGIAQDAKKIAVLHAYCENVFDSVNCAIAYALQQSCIA
jgi:hypothetical protein